VRGASRWRDSGVYPPCDIDKVEERGETWAVDPEMREAFDRLGADLSGEIRTSAAEERVYVNERIETTRVYVDERFETHTTSLIHEMRESESRTRRYFDVVGESLRGEIRGVAELVALSNEGSKRRDDEQAGRTDGLEKRVLRLEVRVLSLEDNRKPRRPRRRR
jgi:hypothetical protein